jgi:integrase/recombinase XerD
MDYLTKDETLGLFEAAKAKGPRELLLCHLLVFHGLRISEALTLTVDQVRSGFLSVQRLKGSGHSRQPLHKHEDELLDETRSLAAYLAVRGDADGSRVLLISRKGSGLTRQQGHKLFRDIALQAGIEEGRANPRVGKHTCASLLLRSGATLPFLQRYLAHKDAKSTMAYLGVSESEANKEAGATFAKVFATPATISVVPSATAAA